MNQRTTPTMRCRAVVSLLIIGSVCLTVAPVAVAQEYAQETGDLELTKNLILTLSGDGFVGDSVVFVTVTANGTDEVIDLGTLEVDSTGAFSGLITLPDDLEPGVHTISATGVTEDGATRVLLVEVSIGGDVTTGSTTPTTTTTLVAGPTAEASAPATTETTELLGLEAVPVAAPDTTTSATTIIVVGLLIHLMLVVISFMKGKPRFGIAGIFGIFAWVGAIRIAKPHSWWARKIYPLGSPKMQTATQRFEPWQVTSQPAAPQPPTRAARPPGWRSTLRDLMRRSPFGRRRDR